MAAKKKARPKARKRPARRPEKIKLLIERSSLSGIKRASAPAKSVSASACECAPIKASTLRIIFAGIVFAIIAQIIHSLAAFASMGYYFMSEYSSVWSKILMPVVGAPPASFYMYSFGFSVITGILFALVFTFFACCIGGNDKLKKGLLYGIGVFLVAGIPMALSLYLLINLPVGLITLWAFEGLIINLIGGVAVAHVVK